MSLRPTRSRLPGSALRSAPGLRLLHPSRGLRPSAERQAILLTASRGYPRSYAT